MDASDRGEAEDYDVMYCTNVLRPGHRNLDERHDGYKVGLARVWIRNLPEYDNITAQGSSRSLPFITSQVMAACRTVLRRS